MHKNWILLVQVICTYLAFSYSYVLKVLQNECILYQHSLWQCWYCVLILAGQSNGNIRLVGGSNRYEGRVEVWYDSRWNTVCDDSWDLKEAKVVCRQFGYRAAVAARWGAYFGQGSGSILLDELRCTGTENSLLSCQRNSLYSHDCRHSEDAGVSCECACTYCTNV